MNAIHFCPVEFILTFNDANTVWGVNNGVADRIILVIVTHVKEPLVIDDQLIDWTKKFRRSSNEIIPIRCDGNHLKRMENLIPINHFSM
jgi:hypothetical protein